MVKGELAYLIGYPAITRLEVDLDHTTLPEIRDKMAVARAH